MHYLLDTQVIIWFINGDDRLPQSVKNAVKDTSNKVSISIVSLWEIAIKRSIGKLEIKADLKDIQSLISSKVVSILPLTVAQLETLENLPILQKHRDPFDRLIISQAITESMIIISSDTHFKDYPVQIFW